jgi:hypothetical protein
MEGRQGKVALALLCGRTPIEGYGCSDTRGAHRGQEANSKHRMIEGVSRQWITAKF